MNRNDYDFSSMFLLMSIPFNERYVCICFFNIGLIYFLWVFSYPLYLYLLLFTIVFFFYRILVYFSVSWTDY